MMTPVLARGLLLIIALQLWTVEVSAMPSFARQFNMSCVTCHAAFPRLNEFGLRFRDDYNLRFPGLDGGIKDPKQENFLNLPRTAPFAARMQAFAQARVAGSAKFDFQSPYYIKLLIGAPVTDNLSYYLYGVMGERGQNGAITVDDAFFRYRDLFGFGINLQFGQFQVSDVLFPRETRLTFQDFLAYPMAGLSYDRGMILNRSIGPLALALGAVNGNGAADSFAINSGGFGRTDRSFDDNTSKSGFAHLGVEIIPVGRLGIFGFLGNQSSAAGTYATETGVRGSRRIVLGFDVSGDIDQKLYWFGQALWNRWDNFLDSDPTRDFNWFGGFAGMDYVHTDRWTFSFLYNGSTAGDFKGSGTVYEGLRGSVASMAVSYYFSRNIRALVEGGVDLLSKEADPDFVGHETREDYFVIGFDAAI